MNNKPRVSPSAVTRVISAAQVSEELTMACAGFGLLPTTAADHHPPPKPIDKSTLRQLRPASITLIVGHSGAGKSTLLRDIAITITEQTIRTVPAELTPQQHKKPSFDLLDGPIRSRTKTLALAGLAEPTLWARPAGSLSAGEQARLRLAITMHRAQPNDLIIADELATSLDRVSAYALCQTIRRWISRTRLTLIAATAHEDLEAMLAPDSVFDAATNTPRKPREHQPQPIHIEHGTIDDYHQLAHHHYRATRPATLVQVLRAIRTVPTSIDPSGRMLAGVLCVSMPTLNSVWRTRAWGDTFTSSDKSVATQRLNQHLRTISRVIIEQRSRGLGIATQLVRAYLDDPLTPATEAIAAMGDICPFFEQAGMTPYTLPPDRIDTRLLDALAYLNRTPATLAHTPITPRSLLMRELITWGKQRKLLPAGEITHNQITQLTPIAACRLCARPRAYAFTKGTTGDEHNTT